MKYYRDPPRDTGLVSTENGFRKSGAPEGLYADAFRVAEVLHAATGFALGNFTYHSHSGVLIGMYPPMDSGCGDDDEGRFRSIVGHLVNHPVTGELSWHAFDVAEAEFLGDWNVSVETAILKYATAFAGLAEAEEAA